MAGEMDDDGRAGLARWSGGERKEWVPMDTSEDFVVVSLSVAEMFELEFKLEIGLYSSYLLFNVIGLELLTSTG